MRDSKEINLQEKVEDNICDLSLSNLKAVPVTQIARFPRITVLDLSCNHLKSLNQNFMTLHRLVKLDLSKNELKVLPHDFGLLRNLKHLDLYDNSLTHLPLSFGDLKNLRYLDLKGNPLNTALIKIVGPCFTTKECQDAAKNTVKLMTSLQQDMDKAKDLYNKSLTNGKSTIDADEDLSNKSTTKSQEAKSKKTKKSKPKKKNSAEQQQNLAADTLCITKAQQSVRKAKTNANGFGNSSSGGKQQGKSKTALTSIVIFLALIIFNVILIYMIMFKNPEIAEKLVEAIPAQYRNWIMTKTEIFRLRITDWISEFRTPPEEH